MTFPCSRYACCSCIDNSANGLLFFFYVQTAVLGWSMGLAYVLHVKWLQASNWVICLMASMYLVLVGSRSISSKNMCISQVDDDDKSKILSNWIRCRSAQSARKSKKNLDTKWLGQQSAVAHTTSQRILSISSNSKITVPFCFHDKVNRCWVDAERFSVHHLKVKEKTDTRYFMLHMFSHAETQTCIVYIRVSTRRVNCCKRIAIRMKVEWAHLFASC